MGSDIQRALLWILFGLSAFMLYDRWEVYNGRPSFFGAETQQVATTEAPKNEHFGCEDTVHTLFQFRMCFICPKD